MDANNRDRSLDDDAATSIEQEVREAGRDADPGSGVAAPGTVQHGRDAQVEADRIPPPTRHDNGDHDSADAPPAE